MKLLQLNYTLQMVRIYVAGKWSEKELIRGYMSQLIKLGHKITHDWTSYESNTANTKADMAFKDVQGVAFADVIVMDDPKYAYRGSFTELGAALGLLKDVYIICPDKDSECRTNVFFHHPDITHAVSWEEFLDKLRISLQPVLY
jgi:hypothetical protein